MLVAVFTLGCREQTARVSGVVKLDGSPLQVQDNQRGTVVLRPVAGGATCTSLIGPDGAFSVSTGSVSGVAPGEYLVSVRVLELVPREDGQAPGGTPTTPAIYADPSTSGLMFKVKAGANEIEIDLDSAAGPLVLPTPVEDAENEAGEDGEGDASDADAAGGDSADKIDAGEAGTEAEATRDVEGTESPVADDPATEAETAPEAGTTEVEANEEGAK